MQSKTLQRAAEYRRFQRRNGSGPRRRSHGTASASIFDHRGNVICQERRERDGWRDGDSVAHFTGRQFGQQRVELSERKTRRSFACAACHAILEPLRWGSEDAAQYVRRHIHSRTRGRSLYRCLLLFSDTNLELRGLREISHRVNCLRDNHACQYICIDIVPAQQPGLCLSTLLSGEPGGCRGLRPAAWTRKSGRLASWPDKRQHNPRRPHEISPDLHHRGDSPDTARQDKRHADGYALKRKRYAWPKRPSEHEAHHKGEDYLGSEFLIHLITACRRVDAAANGCPPAR